MDIKNVITKYDKVFGVTIEDAGDVYPIIMKGLHVPMIFDELLRSGWELHELPFGFKKDGVELESLAKVSHIEAGITEEVEQLLMDTAVGGYKEVDLRSKMVKQPTSYIKFREGTKSIKTREELLRFLSANKDRSLDMDTPLTYMPLNSLVDPDALFTPEEYFSSEYSEFRSMIEDRRNLSLKSFIRLARQLVKMGLRSDYEPKELVDEYFSWGICGMNLKAYDRRVEDKNTLLGAPIYSMKEEEIPYIMEGILTYMGTSGEIYRPATCKGSNYKSALSEVELETKRRELGSYGYEYVAPVFLKTITSTAITTLIAEDLTVQYDDNNILFSYNGMETMTHTLRAVSPADPAKKLETRFFNIIDPVKTKELFSDAYIQAIGRELVKRTITYVDASSYKAIMASGGGLVSSFYKILNSEDFGKDAAEAMLGEDDEFAGSRLPNVPAVHQLINNLSTYMRGGVDPDSKIYDDLSSLVSAVIEGRVNIEATFDGERMDQLAAMGSSLDSLRVAHQYLGVSLEDMASKVMQVDDSTPYIEFKGEGKIIRINLFKRDMKGKGYIADFNAYKVLSAKEACYIHYVKEVYTELGPKGNENPKHVAVQLLSFYKGPGDRDGQKVWKYVSDIFEQEVDRHVVWKEQATMREMLPRLVAQAIFEIAVKGTLTFPKQISGRVLQIDAGTREAINNCIETQYDSTIAISETAITRDGKFYRFCVNATIMDEYVIPNKGQIISEKPFMPMWMDLRNLSVDRKKSWIEKGYIPDYRFPGFSLSYKKLASINIPIQVMSTSIPESVPSYVEWANEYKSDYPKDEEFTAPRHYIYAVYPGLVIDEEDSIDSTVGKKLPAAVEKHLWGLDAVSAITREDMFKRFPALRSCFEIVEALPAPSEGVRRFSSYALEDFFHLSNFDAMQMAPDFGRTERPVSVRQNMIYFMDFFVNFSEVETLDQTKYAVKHLCGRKYLIEDMNGKLWEVVV